jgi:parallel beta-helix repeat protein
MDNGRFDALSRFVAISQSRRRAALALGSAVAGILGTGSVTHAKKKKKKVTLCLDGETIKASSKKKKKLIKQGATPGACKGPAACAANADCGAGAICVSGVCQTCSVTCNGDGPACGTALNVRLAQGGTVYVCPGRYEGVFSSGSVKLIGAGNGEDPATSTILDAQNLGRALTTSDGATVSLARLRIMRGRLNSDTGGGVFAKDGELQVDSCVVESNVALYGGGIHVTNGRLTLKNSTVLNNTATDGGGGILLSRCLQSTIAQSQVTGNKTTSTASNSGWGAGVLAGLTPIAISGTEISRNTATGGGGGLYVNGSTVSLDPATRITNNTAGATYGGGGVYITPGLLIQNGAMITNNTPNNIVTE